MQFKLLFVCELYARLNSCLRTNSPGFSLLIPFFFSLFRRIQINSGFLYGQALAISRESYIKLNVHIQDQILVTPFSHSINVMQNFFDIYVRQDASQKFRRRKIGSNNVAT